MSTWQSVIRVMNLHPQSLISVCRTADLDRFTNHADGPSSCGARIWGKLETHAECVLFICSFSVSLHAVRCQAQAMCASALRSIGVWTLRRSFAQCSRARTRGILTQAYDVGPNNACSSHDLVLETTPNSKIATTLTTDCATAFCVHRLPVR